MAVEMASRMGGMIGSEVAAMRESTVGSGLANFGAQGGDYEGSDRMTFVDSMKQALQAVSEQDRLAEDRMAAVDSGRSDDLVGAMLASQEANLSFSMLMQVRNKVVGAMDELIKLQL